MGAGGGSHWHRLVVGHEGVGKAPEKVFFLLRPCRVKSMVQSSRDKHPKAPEACEHRGPGDGLRRPEHRGSSWAQGGVWCRSPGGPAE